MPTIAVDAMGGESAPEEVVKGVAEASLQTDIQCILVGDEPQLQAVLDGVAYNPEQISIYHTPDFIGMHENAAAAVRHKHHASVLITARLVADAQADALVTAGNTAAALLAGRQCFRLIRGVRKPALASVYPRQTEYPGQDPLALLLDVGAAARADATDLVQFALMGSAYARRVSKVASPRVALLNMSAEPGEGGDALVRAYRWLKTVPGVNFVGNVEGSDLTKGTADVIVCEGLLGDVVIKLLEGLAEAVVDLAATAARDTWRWKLGFTMLAGGSGRPRDMTDYAAYAGAPILGFEHLLVKSHARSSARSVSNAIKVAAKAVRDGVVREIAAAVEHL